MTETTAPPAAAARAPAIAPVGATERIATLDFIRGLAVMGILAANIAAFGHPFEAVFYPGAFLTDPGDPGGWLWIAQYVLIDGKMRGLFTLLFGAGLYLFMEKAWARGQSLALQARRLVVLWLFGLGHFFLLWDGDILVDYAAFGLLTLACLHWSIKAQLAAGLTGYLFGALIYAGLTMPWLITETAFGETSPDLLAERASLLAGISQMLADSVPVTEMITRGDYAALLAYRVTEQWQEPFTSLAFLGFETWPLMLIGVALYRMGFFSGAFDRAGLLRWGWIGVVAGGLVHLAIGLVVQAGGFTFYGTLAAFEAWSPLPRLWMILGLAALLVAYAPGATGWLGDRVRATGRTAFTNYLGTSAVMMVVFHGWGLGLYGQLGRPQLYLVMLLIWALMLAWPKPWLDRFRYGPLEWLWRCLTYGRMFPLRR